MQRWVDVGANSQLIFMRSAPTRLARLSASEPVMGVRYRAAGESTPALKSRTLLSSWLVCQTLKVLSPIPTMNTRNMTRDR